MQAFGRLVHADDAAAIPHSEDFTSPATLFLFDLYINSSVTAQILHLLLQKKSCMLCWRAFSGQPRSLLLSKIAKTSLPRNFAVNNMSSYSVGSLKYISREQLADHIRAKKPGISVIDVRDSDYIGGHIMGCQNVPVQTHDFKMPELARTLADQEAVVFHCSLSQQRGPKSALNYLRERERMGMTKDGGDEKQKVYVLEGGFSKWQEAFVTPDAHFVLSEC